MIDLLPKPVRPLVAFPSVLRASGFIVSMDQTVLFLKGVSLVGPSSMSQIREVAHACFAPKYERRGEFDALFWAHFEGDTIVVSDPEDEEPAAQDDESRQSTPPNTITGEPGPAASSDNILSVRNFVRGGDTDLRQFLREVPKCLPTRRGFRLNPGRRGRVFDINRSMSQIVRFDGDIPKPALRNRCVRQRRLLLLIDISGSMKQLTDDYLRLAHTLYQAATQLEVFTLGTKLTRVTPAFTHRDQEIALARAAQLVVDWDGGTLLGQALSSFILEPRYTNYARGAAVIVLSDGLERDDPAVLVSAVQRISHMAWRLSWATPLAGDPRYQPKTAALRAMLPLLDDLIDGSSLEPLTRFILSLGKPSPTALQVWGQGKQTS